MHRFLQKICQAQELPPRKSDGGTQQHRQLEPMSRGAARRSLGSSRTSNMSRRPTPCVLMRGLLVAEKATQLARWQTTDSWIRQQPWSNSWMTCWASLTSLTASTAISASSLVPDSILALSLGTELNRKLAAS